MNHNQVWTNLRSLLMLQIFALFVCAPAAWSQSFGTNVIGQASACGVTKKYSQSGALQSIGSAFAGSPGTCGSSAVAASSTNLGSPLTGHNGSAGTRGGSAYATTLTYDHLVLTPPPTFLGTSVTITLVDTYSITFTGAGGSGSVKHCIGWTTPRIASACGTVTGPVNGTAKFQIKLVESGGVFQSDITKIMRAQSSAPASGKIVVGYTSPGLPSFVLPTDWSCSFASGSPCRH